MSCRRLAPLIALWVEGDLPARRALRVERHVKGCGTCRALVEGLRETREDLARLREATAGDEALSAMRESVLVSLRQERRAARPGVVGPVFTRARRRLVVAAAVLAVAAATVITVHRGVRAPEALVPAAPRRSAAPSAPVAALPPSEPPETIASHARRRVASGAARPPRSAQPRTGRFTAKADQTVPEPLVIKIMTDDPEVVIYWLVDKERG